ncbi:DUF1983 domain-containing protein [Desulfuromonas sp. KJ2020]|uniref:phage tail tip fiber protein n=1 Tax=Desulfuromonas sp. KJ2020 TaxID=2919173 RepID=UPI0020A736BF|nr:DUF1983 domain-containing protein [Desulfuromonas sp. KJ2020]MCP3177312.1 DUF1983 domain-containing protein [Desulfuromonas sp. KJ2020]
MPSEAYLDAAKSGNREPVILASVESVSSIKQSLETRVDWADSKLLTRVDIDSVPSKVLSQQIIQSSLKPDWPNMAIFAPATDHYLVEVRGTVEISCWTTSMSMDPYFYIVCLNDSTLYNYATSDQKYTGQGTWSYGNKVYVDVVFRFVLSEMIPAGVTPRLQTWVQQVPGLSTVFSSKWASDPVVVYSTPTSKIQTRSIDLGVVPTVPTRLNIDDIVPARASVAYSARGSNDDVTWTSLGSVYDGASLAPYRYYDVTADMTSTGDVTEISRISLSGGDSQFLHLSTHADLPVAGALPVLERVSSRSSQIEFLKLSTTGEVSVDLKWNRAVSDLLATGFVKNKFVTIRRGYVGLAESDFEPVFTGFWHDYATKGRKVTVKLRDVMSRFAKRRIPAEVTDSEGNKITSPVPFNGNVMDVLLQAMDVIGIPDRLLDRQAFLSIRDTHRSGSEWSVRRILGGQDADGKYREPEKAEDVLNELQTIAGVFLVPMPDGRLTPLLYDESAAPVDTLDAEWCDFGGIDGGQKDLYTRQYVYYSPLNEDPSGTSDYARAYWMVNSQAESDWGLTDEETGQVGGGEKTWEEKWNATASAVESLALRMDGWFANPHRRTSATCPPRYANVLPGQIVTVENLRIPAEEANWPGFSNGQRMLVISRRDDPKKGTIEFDLFDLAAGGTPGQGTWVNPIVISGSATPYGAGNVYTAAGGTPPYSWAASAGTLTVLDADSVSLNVTGLRGPMSLSVSDAEHTKVMSLRVPPELPADIVPGSRIDGVHLTFPGLMLEEGDRVAVYTSTTDDPQTATLAGESTTNEYFHHVEPNVTYFYWIKLVDGDGTESPLFPAVNGVEALAGKVAEDHLVQELITPITGMFPLEPDVVEPGIVIQQLSDVGVIEFRMRNAEIEIAAGVSGNWASITSRLTTSAYQADQLDSNGDLRIASAENRLAVYDTTNAPAWDGGTAYSSGTIVSNGGGYYRALKSVPAGTAVGNATYWTAITAGLLAQQTLKLNINGHVAGIGLMLDDTGGSEFAVVADKFKIVNPNLPADIQQVFTVGQINGSGSVGINGNLVLDGTLTARTVGTNLLITDAANIGDAVITSAKIESLQAEKVAAGELRAGLVASSSMITKGTSVTVAYDGTASTLHVFDTTDLPASGTAKALSRNFEFTNISVTYTGKTATTLTGVSVVGNTALPVGTAIVPGTTFMAIDQSTGGIYYDGSGGEVKIGPAFGAFSVGSSMVKITAPTSYGGLSVSGGSDGWPALRVSDTKVPLQINPVGTVAPTHSASDGTLFAAGNGHLYYRGAGVWKQLT